MGLLVKKHCREAAYLNKRVESDSLRRRFAPPPLAAHARRSAAEATRGFFVHLT
jgi:hypothetical protein